VSDLSEMAAWLLIILGALIVSLLTAGVLRWKKFEKRAAASEPEPDPSIYGDTSIPPKTPITYIGSADVAAMRKPSASERQSEWAPAQPMARDPGSAAESGTQTMQAPPPSRTHTIVRVFYATDRGSTGQVAAARMYGADRSVNGKLALGTCEVSIPRDHRLGQLEHPSIWKLEFREDPEKHVVLLTVQQEDESEFWTKLSKRVGVRTGRGEAFVFVHGYNTTFEDAVRRTAQIAYDLGFDGAPICYSWPSYGELADYPKDENNVQWSVPHLKDFLRALAGQANVKMVHLIAHSMGNRAVSYALQLLAAEDGERLCRMHHVVLTAPDIDADTFIDLAHQIEGRARRVTLYVSPADVALALSKRFHGNPRLGESISIITGVDTIDASRVDTTFIGHSYYAENRSVLSDIFWLLKDGKPPKDRFGMREVDRADGIYYEFRP
jgi:esterase/lipase superfamily enzyme